MSSAIGSPEQNARFARAAAEVLREMERENASRPTRTCECGHGPVASVFGCSSCNQDASREFVTRVLKVT